MRKIALWAVLVVGCSAEPLLPSNVIFLPGQESDLWTREPAPARIEVDLVAGDQRTLIGQAPAPTSGLSVDTRQLQLRSFARIDATAFEGGGAVVARGSSATFFLDAIDAVTVPVFVARSGGWSRPPDTLEHPHKKPVVLTILPHLMIAAGGDAIPGVDGSVPDFYNAAVWSTLRSQPPFPRAPKSAGFVLTKLLVIDETGATWLDLSDESTKNATAPEGVSFAEIAGGDTIALPDGTLFIVGATRSTGDPTSKVLRIATDGTLRALALTTPRLGAAAGKVGDKLVVAGGSAAGPGVEVLNDTQSTFVTLGIGPDATTGLGLAALDATTMLLAGGKDPTTGATASVRTLDVSCGSVCTASDLGPMPSALQSSRVFRVDAGKLLITGETDDGETHAYSIAIGGASPEIVEQPLRERRKGASAVVLPNGQVGLVGGVSVDAAETAVSTFEAYIP
jgi:hypothetical protein